MTNFSSSPGVYVREIDLSQRIDAVSSSIGAIVGALDKGPVNERTLITSVKNFIETFGKPNPATSYVAYSALAFLQTSSRLYVTRVISDDALTAGAYLSVDDASAATPRLRLTNFDNGANVPLGVVDPFNSIILDPNTPGIQNVLLYFCAISPGTWNNSLYIQVRPSTKKGVETPDDPYQFWVDVFVNYTNPRQPADESFLVTIKPFLDGFGNQTQIEEVINHRSKFIRVRLNPYAATGVKFLTTASEFLDGATDGARPTSGKIISGWDLYTDPEQVEVNILINGGYANVEVQRKMTELCESRMDCIAVLDTPSDQQQVADAVQYRRNDLNLNSSYAALYTPDIKIQDTYNDRVLLVPPSGYVAAAYALTDSVAELWFAPAGMFRGDLNCLGVRQTYNEGDAEALVGSQINFIKVFPSDGYKIWGADTLQSSASALSNVNVRRLLNFLEKSISIASLYSVFEPNDSVLWDRLTEMVERFLRPIRAGRALYNFQVICNETNNVSETIANGDTILDVYLDPVIPAKRIHLNAIVTKTGANFRELILQRSANQILRDNAITL